MVILSHMDPKTKAIVDALLVVVLTPHIKTYLIQHDPKALEQARNALQAFAISFPHLKPLTDQV